MCIQNICSKRIYSKWARDSNIRSKIIKFLEKKYESIDSGDLRLGLSSFLGMTVKQQEIDK